MERGRLDTYPFVDAAAFEEAAAAEAAAALQDYAAHPLPRSAFRSGDALREALDIPLPAALPAAALEDEAATLVYQIGCRPGGPINISMASMLPQSELLAQLLKNHAQAGALIMDDEEVPWETAVKIAAHPREALRARVLGLDRFAVRALAQLGPPRERGLGLFLPPTPPSTYVAILLAMCRGSRSVALALGRARVVPLLATRLLLCALGGTVGASESEAWSAVWPVEALLDLLAVLVVAAAVEQPADAAALVHVLRASVFRRMRFAALCTEFPWMYPMPSRLRSFIAMAARPDLARKAAALDALCDRVAAAQQPHLARDLRWRFTFTFMDVMRRHMGAAAALAPHRHRLGICINCFAPTPQRCGQCSLVYYCSQACQRRSWSQHKSECVPGKGTDNLTTG